LGLTRRCVGLNKVEKGSKAYTAFHVHLKSGQCMQLNRDVKCYFRNFAHVREVILGLFFTKLTDPIAVIEKNLKRIKLTLTINRWADYAYYS